MLNTSFPSNSGVVDGEGQRRGLVEGVKYSTSWSDLARLQRVMKQLQRSATYTPISLPNERMSRTQVKNELAQRSPLREKNVIPLLRKTAHIPTYYCYPPPLLQTQISMEMID